MSDLPYSQDSYAYFMEQLLNNYKSGGVSAELFDADKEDIILNNWFDNIFIKTEHITKDGETRFTEVYAGKVLAKQKVQTENGIEEKDVQEMVSFPSVLLGITNTPEGWRVTYENETIPKYIKIRRTTCGDKES
jgi:hypothetical protein